MGGLAYLAALMHRVPTAVHIEYYAHIVERNAVLRRLISVGGQIAGLGYEEGLDLPIVLDKAESAPLRRHPAPGQRQISCRSSACSKNISTGSTLVQHQKGNVVGVPTGFHDLDELTGGLQKSDLVIVAARPSVGQEQLRPQHRL